MKVVLQFRIGDTLRARIAAMAPDWLEVAAVDELDHAAFKARMRDAQVLWHVLAPVTREVIAGAPELLLVQKIGVGLNTIDLDAAFARGIAVANLPGTNSQAVAELALLLMLSCLRRLPQADRATRAGRGWEWKQDAIDSAGELRGRTVGLVGYGEVAVRLAPVLVALGARVLYTDPVLRPDAVGCSRDLRDLLVESDIVSLHVPLNRETEKMINRDTIEQMKPGAILINTARGGLVDEEALDRSLRDGRIAAAGLDVFAVEPAEENKLFHLDNVVVTPHLAWLSTETFERSLTLAIENCRRLRDGEPLLHRIAP